jgi:predicted dehydrogenase
MKKIKVGIIGTGSISGVHITGYKALSNVELHAVCDINESRARACAERNGIKHIFTDYNEMLKLEELDAVSVCTWNNVHAPASIAALKAGKHVLCEKPMAMNYQEAVEMEKAAKEAGKLLMIGFVRRFGNDARILKDFIDSGMLGEVYFSKASYLRRFGAPGGWFGDSKRSGGGPLIDLGVHVIDLVRYLTGKPKAVSVYGATFNRLGLRSNIKGARGYVSADSDNNFDVEDLAVALIRFDNGSLLSLETSFSLNIKNDSGNIELFGTKSGARLDPKLEFYSEMNDYLVDIAPAHNTALSFDGLFENEMSHFIDCITKGKECISPAEDGVELMKIIDGIYRSAKNEREELL